MSDQNTTYVAQGLDRLLDQFDGSVNLRLLATSYLNQVQELEDAAYPLLAERSLANATGDRLDGFGAIVNVSRGGRDDTTYRLRLSAELAILTSQGSIEEILTIAQLLIQMDTADYEVIEYVPKTLYLSPEDYAFTPEPISEWFYDSGTSGIDEYVRVHDETQSIFDIWVGQNDANSLAQNTALGAINSQDLIRISRLDNGSFFDAWVSTASGDQGDHYEFICVGDSESDGFAWPADDTRMSVSRIVYGDYEVAKAFAALLRRAVSAATDFLFVYSMYDDGDTFTLSSLPTTVQTSTTQGLAGLGRDTGGHLAGGL